MACKLLFPCEGVLRNRGRIQVAARIVIYDDFFGIALLVAVAEVGGVEESPLRISAVSVIRVLPVRRHATFQPHHFGVGVSEIFYRISGASGFLVEDVCGRHVAFCP